MDYFVFDTETSGLCSNKKHGRLDEVIQLSGLLLSDNFDIKKVVNIYCNITFPINPEAIAVHGIDNTKLEELSNGKFLEDYLCTEEFEFLRNPKDIVFIAYNTKFDKTMINNSLESNGYDTINFGKEVNVIPPKGSHGVYNMCLMKGSKVAFRYPYNQKLSFVIEQKLGDSPESISKKLDVVCKWAGIQRPNKTFHDALYDSFALSLLLLRYRAVFIA